MRSLIPPAMLVAASLVACGGEGPVERVTVASFGALTIYDAYAPASPLNDVASVYFTVVNSSAEPDTLLGVRIPIGTAHLHEVVTENDLTRMRPVQMLSIPARGELRLAPGGYHVMLSQMESGIAMGDTINVELQFARGGNHTIPVVVLTYTQVLQRLGLAHDSRR